MRTLSSQAKFLLLFGSNKNRADDDRNNVTLFITFTERSESKVSA